MDDLFVTNTNVKIMSNVDFQLVCVYVGDLLITNSYVNEIQQFKNKMKSEFDTSKVGFFMV